MEFLFRVYFLFGWFWIVSKTNHSQQMTLFVRRSHVVSPLIQKGKSFSAVILSKRLLYKMPLSSKKDRKTQISLFGQRQEFPLYKSKNTL